MYSLYTSTTISRVICQWIMLKMKQIFLYLYRVQDDREVGNSEGSCVVYCFHQDPLTKDEINRRSLVVWNSSCTGPRRPPEFIPRRWPLAFQIPNKHHVERSMAIRWHLGTFPIPLPSSPLQTHLRLQLRTLLRKPTRDVQRYEIQRARRIISAIMALAHGDVPNITNI